MPSRARGIVPREKGNICERKMSRLSALTVAHSPRYCTARGLLKKGAMQHSSRLEQKDPRDLVSWVNQIVWLTATATRPRFAV